MSEDARSPGGDLVLYRTEDGRTRIECRFEEGTIWLSQVQLAELFQTSVPNINTHLKAIYAEGEVDAAATIKSYLTVRVGAGSVSRETAHKRAKEEYGIFDGHRRLLAETEAMRQLEAAAQRVEKTKSDGGAKKGRRRE